MIPHLLFAVFIIAGTVAAFVTKKLTLPAALTGALVGSAIYAGVGWIGVALLSAFFGISTACTSYNKGTKERLGLAQEGGSRKTGQVVANGGVAAILGGLAVLFYEQETLLLLMIAGAFSAATADTVSSEMGSVHGKKFYDILTFGRGVRGRDGVISIEGLLFGIIGSFIVAVIYAAGTKGINQLLPIVVAGTVGNLADSYLGATLERRGIIGNNAVNFINTAVGAATAAVFAP